MIITSNAISHVDLANHQQVLISVCICTSNRSTLSSTLTSVLQQNLPESLALEIVVVDNSKGKAQSIVRSLQNEDMVTIKYIADTTKNLSIIRNRATKAANGHLVAFIDDDEIAEPGWIVNLYRPLRDGRADIAVGKVAVNYSPDCPDWISAAGLLDKPNYNRFRNMSLGYTANAMVPIEIATQFPFDPQFGQTGGEDTAFFFSAYRYGHRIKFVPNAVVNEYVDPGKENWNYLVSLNKAIGHNYHNIVFVKLSSFKKLLEVISIIFKSVSFFLLLVPGLCMGKAYISFLKLRLIRNITKIKWVFGRGSYEKLYCIDDEK